MSRKTVKSLVWSKLELMEASNDFNNNLDGDRRQAFISSVQLAAYQAEIPVLATTVDRYIRKYSEARTNSFKSNSTNKV